MPRPQRHPTDVMLDAARDLLNAQGPQSATIDAIAADSGAPIGSIYHRFGSRGELIARLWIRAVERSQRSFLAALEHPRPEEAALAAAMSILDFCAQHPGDARLLVTFRREDLIGSLPEGSLAEELTQLNRPVERAMANLAERLYGSRSRSAVNRAVLAVFDLPYGAVRRYLIAGERLPPSLRRDLTVAISALVAEPSAGNRQLREANSRGR